jgi:endonuclease G
MFFRPKFRASKPYIRRGFRLRGNTLTLLLGFFMVGLFLHYNGRTEPMVAFWNDLRGLFGIRTLPDRKGHNPYKVPEPGSSDRRTDESEATANNTASAGSEVDVSHSAEQRTSGTLFDARPRRRWRHGPSLDYTKSGYDRGHLAPAGDFKFSQQLTKQSFFMSNISPQTPQFNRGIWKSLEEQVRSWALRDGGLYVVTGPVLRSGLPTIGRTNEVAVPDSFYKVLLYCRKGSDPEIRMIGFLLKNEPSNESLKSHVVPVDAIEQATGLDFFPKIPDDLERRLESQSRSQMVNQWFDR